MKAVKFVLRTIKGLYDIVGTYLMALLVPFAIAALGLYAITLAAAAQLGFDGVDALWAAAEAKTSINSLWLRIGIFLPFHILLFRILSKPLERVTPYFEKVATFLINGFKRATEHFPWGRASGEFLFSVALTMLVIPFVIQPTLVRGYLSPTAWAERAANLMDGTATITAADSVIGLYRKFYAQPVVVEGVAKAELDQLFDKNDIGTDASGPIAGPKPTGKQPMMDRWDPYIEKATKGDAQQFAFVKAFMWVESGGRQYAVSHTGCAGLMQFCTGTARSQPFKSIFGTGQVYKCQCNGPCRIPKETQKALETGDPDALEKHKSNFPCEMTGARFNPTKAINAGSLYVKNLSDAVGGNIYLMYIGYNSGPKVAKKVWRASGKNPDVGLDEIEKHLADALRASFPGSAERRAKSLTRTHLPKLKRAYLGYLKE